MSGRYIRLSPLTRPCASSLEASDIPGTPLQESPLNLSDHIKSNFFFFLQGFNTKILAHFNHLPRSL